MSIASRRFVARDRTPLVRIEYPVNVYGADKRVELPFVIGVLADLSGRQYEPLPPLEERKFFELDFDNFNAFMRSIQPRVAFHVKDTVSGVGTRAVDLTFDHMECFSPYWVVLATRGLHSFHDARKLLEHLQTYLDGNSRALSLVNRLIADRRMLAVLAEPISDSADNDTTGEETARRVADPEGAELVTALIAELRTASGTAHQTIEQAVLALARSALSTNLEGTVSIERLIGELDRSLSMQVAEIIHHPAYQLLEGTWRGLHFLVNRTATSEKQKICVLNITKKELATTIETYKGVEWNASPLFKKVCGEVYEALGADPYALLVGDYFFDHSSADVDTLAGIAQIAAAAHAPFIAGVSAACLQMDTWREIARPRDLAKIITTPEYVSWRALRESDDARYLVLAMPRVLARAPFRNDPFESFAFSEVTRAEVLEDYTWMNAAYAMAVNVNQAFTEFRWCTRIFGVEGGGMLENLQVHEPGDESGLAIGPTEVPIADRRQREICELGILPLLQRKGTDSAVFMEAPTLQSPAEHEAYDVTRTRRLGSKLPYVLALSRFAHYVRCIGRDCGQSWKDAEEAARSLNDWIKDYVDDDPGSSSDTTKARRPLAAAEISVHGAEGGTARYRCRLLLRPSYQVEEFPTSVRLDVPLC